MKEPSILEQNELGADLLFPSSLLVWICMDGCMNPAQHRLPAHATHRVMAQRQKCGESLLAIGLLCK